MVAETRQNMNKMFDNMNDAFRSAFDASRRAQETWFKAGREMWEQPGDFNRMFAAGEQMSREFAPVVQKNFEMAANAFGANFRAGMDVFNNAFEMTQKGDDANVYEKTRRMFDSAFDVARANMDFVSRATARSIENCAAFCDAVRPSHEPTGKSGEPTGKANPGK